MVNPPERPASRDVSVLEAWRQLRQPRSTRLDAHVPAGRQSPPGLLGLGAVIALLNLSALAAIAAAAFADPTWGMAASLIHVAVIPGLLLAFILAPTDELDLAEWLTLAFGLGMLLLVVGGLVLAQLPGPVGPLHVVGWTALLTLGLATVAFPKSIGWQAPRLVPVDGTRWGVGGIVLVLVVAALLRLPGLGYAEFQGDETEVILRATGVVRGWTDALYYHGKGPGEIIAVSLPYGLAEVMSEDAGRLPFALSGIMGAVAFALVARRLLGEAGGVAAGLLIAVNGYFVAFSRISQYQTLVMLLGMSALWCAIRWSQGGSRIWPVLAGAFAAAGALCHYDTLFVLPPIAVAVLWRTGWRGLFDLDLVRPWLNGAVAGLIVLALFFVPYFESPLFSLVTDRVNDRVGAGGLRNNVSSIVASGTLYLGAVYPVLVAGLAALGLAGLVARGPGRPPVRAWLLALIWAGLPLIVSAFIARKPGTHVHVATSGLMLLAAAGFATVWAALPALRGSVDGQGAAVARAGRMALASRLALSAVLAAGLGLVVTYLGPVYFQSNPEMVRENRLGSLPLAWRPPGGWPNKERFGFPYQAGWKAIGALYANGTLSGSYDSNEQPQVTYWYTRGAWRCDTAPRYYFIAENVQDEIDTPERVINQEYHPIGRVTVAGEAKLRVYERGRAAAGARPATWAVEDLTWLFEMWVSVPLPDPGVWARGPAALGSQPLAVSYGEEIRLFGYQVLAEDPRPGGVVRLDLYWLPQVNARETHRIDVQLGRDPRIGDAGGPACESSGDERDWRAGRPFVQRVSIPIAPTAQPGQYPLLVSVSRTGSGGGPLTPTGGPAADDEPLVEIGQIEIGSGTSDRSTRR